MGNVADFFATLDPNVIKETMIELIAPVASEVLYSMLGKHTFPSHIGCIEKPYFDVSSLNCIYFSNYLIENRTWMD